MQALDAYPGGEVPSDLVSAYAIQDEAIAAWPDTVAGWKVAAIQPQWRAQYTAERLAGPVFSRAVWNAANQAVDVPLIEGGYAAVEAEFAIRLSRTIDLSQPLVDTRQLLPYVESVHVAVEIAASPLASLSALGPGAVISDFGNNSGLVVGAGLPLSLLSDPASAISEMEINGVVTGRGDASRIPGGPLAALLFLANHLASRGRTLAAGDWISTGASTGIHPVKPGDVVVARFNRDHAMTIRIGRALAAS